MLKAVISLLVAVIIMFFIQRKQKRRIEDLEHDIYILIKATNDLSKGKKVKIEMDGEEE